MDVKGEVLGNTVNLSMNTGKEEISEEIQLKSPPFLATNRRAYLLSPVPQVGRKVRIPYFDPFTLSVQNSIVEYKGLEKTLIKGRVFNLHRFMESYVGIRVSSWLDEAGEVVKEESPAGFVFIAEPEFRARDIGQAGKELLSAVSVPLLGKLPDLTERNFLHYKLTLPEGGEFELNRDRQAFADGILAVTLEAAPEEGALACAGKDAYLSATPYVQANHQEIGALVSSLKLEKMPPWQKVKVLASWVYENLEKKPVLGLPDAVGTLENLRGDCNEHSALFAALARNAQIPTRIAAGVTLHQGAFYYHAWNEVCIGGSWISLDTTLNQLPADLGHLKFVEGETKEQVRIGALLGKLKIEVLK
jgi:transglutaminase-like putative cysteine protease